jgi:ATP-dependent Clp protease ATP-binding subunit ClpA
LLGLLREHDGVAAQVLMNLGLKLEEVRREVLNLLGAGVESEEPQAAGKNRAGKGKSKTPALDSFGRDLTELGPQGKLDPVIGRKNEIERVIQILCSRARRTTRSCSARPASARRPSSRAWPRWSSRATCRRSCTTAASSCSTWR